MRGPCMCGDPQCPSCGAAQGTLITITDSELPHCGYCDGFHEEPECEAKREHELTWALVQWCQATPAQRVPEDTLSALRALVRMCVDDTQQRTSDELLRAWLESELLK